MYRMQIHGPRDDRHALADRQGRRLPLRGRRGARRGPAGDRLPRRPAGADPGRDRAAAREPARAAARLAGARRAAAPLPGPGRAPAGRRRRVRAGRARAPGAGAPKGPFGDHYGYYSLAHDYPVFDVEWIARRRDAIFPATVVGKPRQEDFFLGDLLQELLSPLFPLVMPGVVDLWSYGETGYHSLAAAVVRERYAREAMASAFRILGEGQLSLTKFLFVVDRPRDLRDFPALLVARARADAAGDRPVRLRQPVDGHARLHRPRGQPGLEGRLARARASRCASCRASSGRRRRRHRKCATCASSARAAWSWAARSSAPSPAPRRGSRPTPPSPAGRCWCSTDEPAARGREPGQLPLDHVHPLRARRRPPRRGDARRAQPPRARGPILIDARMKPWYPDELFCDAETARSGRPALAGVLPGSPRRDGRLRPRVTSIPAEENKKRPGLLSASPTRIPVSWEASFAATSAGAARSKRRHF